MIISNVIDGSNLGFNVGDRIEVFEVDMSSPNMINIIYNKLIYIDNNESIKLKVNDIERIITPYSFFN